MKIWAILILKLILTAQCAQAVGEPFQNATTAKTGKVHYDISCIAGSVITNDAPAIRDPRFSEFEPGIIRYENDGGISHFVDSERLRKGEVVQITGIRNVQFDKNFKIIQPALYEILVNGEIFYIQQSKVFISDINRLFAMPADVVAEFKKNAMLCSLNDRLKKLNEVKKAVEKTSKHGLTLLTHRIYRTGNYKDNTGFSVSVNREIGDTPRIFYCISEKLTLSSHPCQESHEL